MHSNTSYNTYTVENAESYHEVFKVLDSLGMADLKVTFQEHCIQDQTLHYVETEDELKQLLREIGIPLGRCIPIMKSWRKRYSSQETVRSKDKVSTAENYSQTSIVTMDASIQTEDILISAADYNKILNSELNTQLAELNNQQELLNHYAALASGEFNLKLTEAQSGSFTSGQVPSSYGTQSLDPYTAQLWSNLNQYQDQYNMCGGFLQGSTANVAGGVIPDSNGGEASSVRYNQNMSDVNHVMVPSPPSPVPSQDMGQYQRVTANVSNRKDVVDEREDQAIEQSLKDFETMEMESQHSYASAVNSETADLSQDSQHSYGSNTEQHSSYYMQSSQRMPLPYTSRSSVRSTQTTSRPVPSEKSDSSRFAKCDDISLDSGTTRLPSSIQSVGPQTLQGYLDSLPESNEYKEAMKSKNPKKGWKPIDGKHIQSGKKVAFKPVYWDKEGRMRHGVAVRGSDKSEECWRHVEGKAPAGCTFAHSRLGDTLQFVCVKCSYERNPYDWCSDKTKHKQYIFNLGPYRNLEGGVWKKIS